MKFSWIFCVCIIPAICARSLEKRQVPPGGQKIANLTDPLVVNAAEAAVDILNERRGYSDTKLRLSLSELTNGTLEVVSGEMYRLILDVKDSRCLNTLENIGRTENECPVLQDSTTYNCWLQVLFRNWDITKYRLLNYTCTPPTDQDNVYNVARVKKAKVQLGVKDPLAVHAADVAVNELNRLKGFSCCTYRDSVKSITSAYTEPTMDGNSYEMVIKTAQSFCTNNLNNKNTPSSSCPIQPGSTVNVCTVYVTLDSTNSHLKALRNSDCYTEGTTGKPAFG